MKNRISRVPSGLIEKKAVLPESSDDRDPLSHDRAVAGRRRGAGVRAWLRIDEEGNTEVMEADKYAIMKKVFIPARDLRILDPNLSYPSTILGREQAIVVNLEQIKCIITASEVLILNWKLPEVAALVEDLKIRLPTHFNAYGEQVAGDGGSGLSASELEAAFSEPFKQSSPSKPPQNVGVGVQRLARAALGLLPKAGSENFVPVADEERSVVKRGGPNALPFEFRALEACLGAACGFLEKEASHLEGEAYPALDELTGTISTLNLERVRQIKSRLVTISGRVQKVRDELEHLLDDDGDMYEMYLTEKKRILAEDAIAAAGEFVPPKDWGSESSEKGFGSEFKLQLSPGSLSRDGSGRPNKIIFEPLKEPEAQNFPLNSGKFLNPLSIRKPSLDAGGSSIPSSTTSSSKPLDVEELEMLLEAYFVQIEGTLNKLSSLREYVDDTEDYIKIMLDDKQNSLLQMSVALTTATLFISMFVVVTGVFGMNIPLWLFDPSIPSNHTAFYYIVFGCTVCAVVLFTTAILYIKHKGLIA